MRLFIKALTTDGTTEFFNLERIINIAPRENGTVKILMGAGLYRDVYPYTIEYVDCINEFMREIREVAE